MGKRLEVPWRVRVKRFRVEGRVGKKMEMTKAMLKKFRDDFAQSVKELEKEYDVSISLGSISYSDTEFTSKVTVKSTSDVAQNKEIENKQKEFATYAMMFGFKPEDYNREFIVQGKTFKLIGFNPNCRKNICRIMEISTGKLFKCSEMAIPFHCEEIAKKFKIVC